MSSVSFWRNYQFLNLTKTAIEDAQKEFAKTPSDDRWGGVASMAWHNGKVVAALCAETPACIGVAALRSLGFCKPLPPEPPVFPSPHDNAGFMEKSVERALWDWKPGLAAEMREGIADGLSEKWNVFQVIGEWCLLFSYENEKTANYYKPTFLTVSEPLENGQSYRSVGIRFGQLGKKDKAAIFEAIYHQSEIGKISPAGKEVYKDLRALGAKLQQGNQAFISAYKEYGKQLEEASDVEPGSDLAQRVTEPPISAAHVPTPVTLRREPQPYVAVRPSAPDFVAEELSEENRILRDLRFMRTAFYDGTAFLSQQERNKIADLVKGDASSVLSRGNAAPETSPKYCVARLALLHFFKKAFKERGSLDAPAFFWIRSLSESGKTMHEVGQTYALLQERDYARIQQAILHPLEVPSLDQTLRKRLAELNEFAELVAKNPDFSKMYEKLQLDLIAG